MAYFAPYIDATGFHMPSYTDIRDQMIADAKSIFGQDIYLGIDSQDYQWISANASKIYDSFLASQAVYNSRGPSTAIGSGLDIIVKLNGIKRLPAVYSTCYVTLTGTAGTTINNGVVGDVNGYDWNLSSPITLDSTGHSTALATCQTAGPIQVNVGDISKIVTPTYGWTSVTNTVTATVGSNVESDSQLRSRQAISTSQPSVTVLEGIEGAIAAVSGVTRFRTYENDTNSADSNGLPAHSITAVVEGGTDSNVAQAIFNKKTPGCYTNGTSSVTVVDTYGNPATIRFYRPIYVDIDVVVNVKKLAGYTTDTTTAIQNAISSYNNSLAIGAGLLNISSLWGAALSVNTVPTKPLFSITSLTAARHLGAQLSGGLVSGSAYTSIPVQALLVPVPSGSTLVIGTGATTQTITTSAAAAVGATTISVNSFTANAAYAVGTAVSFQQGTTDIVTAFNEVTRGNVSYITVNAI